MTAGCEHLEYRLLRAPREDGSVLFDPSWEEVPSVISANLGRWTSICYDVQGKCLSRLAAEARTELLQAARQWTGQYCDLEGPGHSGSRPVFLAGHQPQMFHPGVWLKNFALNRLAEEHGAVGVNLIVDNDSVRHSTLRVPGGSIDEPMIADIPFDRPGPLVPFEERAVLDRDVFDSFADRVRRQIGPLVDSPLIEEYWPLVRWRADAGNRLGACLAQARHRIERQWGSETLEVPQSTICDAPAYRWFLCHLLDELSRFRRAYNDVVRQYRAVHRIRSLAHPVPDLAETDGWLEAPFWIWRTGHPRRRRLFVRRVGEALLLTNRHDLELTLPLAPGGDPAAAVEQLDRYSGEGVRIRSRALITTLWARLALGDLFLHGIGGAKYDQVTDALMARFFALQPPDFLTVSATLHLPIARPKAGKKTRAIREELRRLEFQPERYLDGSRGEGPAEDPRLLAEEKRGWVDKNVTGAECRQRFLAIRSLNHRLQRWVGPRRRQLLHELQAAERAERADALLTWREYAFCLYPAGPLQDFFERSLPKRG